MSIFQKKWFGVFCVLLGVSVFPICSLADVAVGKRADHAGVIRYCQVAKGYDSASARQNFEIAANGFETEVLGVCESGSWFAIVKSSGGWGPWACGHSCGAASREEAIELALRECQKWGGECDLVRSAFDDGDAVWLPDGSRYVESDVQTWSDQSRKGRLQ
jgi:hypothetical protein